MTEVKITIAKKNLLVAAMVRGLADAIGGHRTVSGATDFRLRVNGWFAFHFNSDHRAQEFREAVSKYLGQHGAVAD